MNPTLSLTKDSIPSLIKKIAIPASVGTFFQTMFNIVDTLAGIAIFLIKLGIGSLVKLKVGFMKKELIFFLIDMSFIKFSCY